MTDMLARRRLKNNLLDRLDDARSRVARLERTTVEADDSGNVWAAGLVLPVLTATPPAPPAGHVLVYAAEDGAGTVYLRAIDAAGTIKTLESWV